MEFGAVIGYLPPVCFQVFISVHGSVTFELPTQSSHLCLITALPLLGIQLMARIQHHHVGRVIDPKSVPAVVLHVVEWLLDRDHRALWQDLEGAKSLLGVAENQSVDISGLILDCGHDSRLAKRLAEDAQEQKAAAMVSFESEIFQEDLFELGEREGARSVEVLGYRTSNLTLDRTRGRRTLRNPGKYRGKSRVYLRLSLTFVNSLMSCSRDCETLRTSPACLSLRASISFCKTDL
jgi:hypothetical protein